MKFLSTCFSFVMVLVSCELHAQKILEITEPLAQKMEWYGIKKNPPVLFVHFDKNVYVSNEPVWFTAYLFETKQDPGSHHALVVNLIRNDDSVLLKNEKFILEKGLSFGRLLLPDSLVPGQRN